MIVGRDYLQDIVEIWGWIDRRETIKWPPRSQDYLYYLNNKVHKLNILETLKVVDLSVSLCSL